MATRTIRVSEAALQAQISEMRQRLTDIEVEQKILKKQISGLESLLGAPALPAASTAPKKPSKPANDGPRAKSGRTGATTKRVLEIHQGSDRGFTSVEEFQTAYFERHRRHIGRQQLVRILQNNDIPIPVPFGAEDPDGANTA